MWRDMENKELIKKLINFDEDDTSTGFNSVTSSNTPKPINGFRFVWYAVNYPYTDKEKRDKINPFANWLNTVHLDRWGQRYITNMTLSDMLDEEESVNEYQIKKAAGVFCITYAERKKFLWDYFDEREKMFLNVDNTYNVFKRYRNEISDTLNDILSERGYTYVDIKEKIETNLFNGSSDTPIRRNYFERVYGVPEIEKGTPLWDKVVEGVFKEYVDMYKDFLERTLKVMDEILKSYPVWCQEHE